MIVSLLKKFLERTPIESVVYILIDGVKYDIVGATIEKTYVINVEEDECMNEITEFILTPFKSR
jgi:hypothetical protein